MFKQRLITTLVLVPLVLLSLYFLPAPLLLGLVALILVGLYLEGLRLIPAETWVWRVGTALGLGVMLSVAYQWLPQVLVLDLALWAMIWLAVGSYPSSEWLFDHRLVVAFVLCFLFTGCVAALTHLYTLTHGSSLILYVLCIVWATDIGAYLVGRQWGRTKLIPMVSPGKTIEGALGGIGFASVVSIIGCLWLHEMPPLRWFVISLGTMLMAMMGDLLISMLKRRCHLKDTGTLFPGHGGLLDRLDSAIAAFPFFVVLYERWM